MSHMVETMAWTNQKPWHGLGFEVGGDLTPEQMLRAAKVDWTVSKRPVFWQPNGKAVPIEDKFVLVRDSDESVLSMVGKGWKPVQNAEAFDFFRKFCEAGNMTMETAGSLWGGRYVWCLARVGADFSVGKGKHKDQVNNYLLLLSPHVFGYSMVAQFTSVCVVCWNTLNMALGAGLKGSKSAFRMPHSTAFDDATKRRAETALGIAVEQAGALKEQVTLLSKASAKAEEVDEFFFEVLRYDPTKKPVKKDGEAREPRFLPLFREALVQSPGATLNVREGTWWGAVNAVTYVVDHVQGRTEGGTLRSAWLSDKAHMKRRALDAALRRAS
jgi:phage/plasmid-like protein (TIGR03299 family)